jgi:hypothetical protein
MSSQNAQRGQADEEPEAFMHVFRKAQNNALNMQEEEKRLCMS